MKNQNSVLNEYCFFLLCLFVEFKWKMLLFAIGRVGMYFIRWIRYECLMPKRCDVCNGFFAVYFLRSECTVNQGKNKEELFDWLICQTDDCNYAIKLKDWL